MIDKNMLVNYNKNIWNERVVFMYIGIDIGGTKCAVVSGDENGNILDKVRFDTTDVKDTLNNILVAVEKLGKAKTIGISCGGPLDSDMGIIMSPPNLPGWDDIHIVDIIEERFNTPCAIENDANACALAEYIYGAGKNTKNMVFFTFGTGLERKRKRCKRISCPRTGIAPCTMRLCSYTA